MIRRNIPITLGALFIALLLVPGASAETSSSRAQAFVENLAQTAIAELTNKNLSLSEQQTRFRRIVEQNVAVKSIARWVIGGRHWRRTTEEQRERYLSLFTDLMVATYAHRFQDYQGETIRIQSVQPIDESQTIVRSRIQRPGADRELQIDWRVRETSGQFRVIDVMVEGLSMAQTQRSEFASFMRANGNRMDLLLTELERRLANAQNGALTEAAQKP